jgi:hypothetical protein
MILVPKTHQNDTVLVSIVLVSMENPNLNQNDAVLILILIFFLQEDILVTYHCQNNVILIFPSTLTVMLTDEAKMQLYTSLGAI